MAKFCAECGGPLGPADKFCAECGKQVIHTCLTCGQNWDGVKQEPVNATPIKTQSKPTPTPPPAPQAVAQPVKASPKSSQLTTARVQPVYGSQYNASTDCANCGGKGNKKSCSNCGAGE